MGRGRYFFGESIYPHFVTCTIVGWLPVFSRPWAVQIILDSWQFLQDQNRLIILGFVILENHLHLIASSENLAKEIGDFKSFTARKIIDQLIENGDERMLKSLENHKISHKSDRRFQLWQEGNHPVKLENETILTQKLEYIHANPVRRGYIEDPTHWRYSSARNYAKMESLISITTEW